MFWDQWSVLDILMNGNGHICIKDLWAQHNEHRVPVQTLLCLADVLVFDGRNISLFVDILIVQIGQVLLFTSLLVSFSGLSRSLSVTVIGLALYVFLSPLQMEDFVWGYQIGFLLSGFAVSLSIAAALYYSQVTSEHPWIKRCLLALAIASACIAEGSLANGLLAWPLLILLSWTLEYHRRHKTVLLLSATAMTFVYLYKYRTPPVHGNPLHTVRTPGRLLKYILTYLGFSWDAALPNPSAWPSWSESLTVLGVAVLLIMAVKYFRHPRGYSSFEVFVLLNGLFALGSALLTSLGRVTFGYQQATASRYQSFALTFWLSVAALAAIYIARSTWRLISASQVILLVLLIAEPARWGLIEAYASARQDGASRAWDALNAHRYSDSALLTIFPDAPTLTRYYEFLRARSLGPLPSAFPESMLDAPQVIKTNVPANIKGFGAFDTCAGFIDAGYLLNGELKIVGWAYDLSKNAPPDSVALVSSSGDVVGSAPLSIERADVVKAMPTFHGSLVGWSILISPQFRKTYRAFAINNAAHTACSLQNAIELTSER